jgi:hypothetical protein
MLLMASEYRREGELTRAGLLHRVLSEAHGWSDPWAGQGRALQDWAPENRALKDREGKGTVGQGMEGRSSIGRV